MTFQGTNGKPPRILTVDDELVILMAVETVLGLEGYTTIPVEDSGKAAEMIKTEKFDLVITDLRMHPLDGMEILRLVRKFQSETPVIMLTAYGSPTVMAEARELGVLAFLGKPFNPGALIDAVNKALGRA